MKKILLTLLMLVLVIPNSFATPVEVGKDIFQATVNIVCRDTWNKGNMGGGSGSVIWHKAGESLVILTALHVTEGCKDAGGKVYLEMNDKLYDKEGEVLSDEPTYTEVKEIAIDKQHDLSILETERKFKEEYKYYKMAAQSPDYGAPVWTAGYPGPFRNPATLILTQGIVNAPHAPVLVCEMNGDTLSKLKEQKKFWNTIVGVKVNEMSVWECPTDRDYPTVYIDIVLHDAQIGPGNSGGSLFNESFELVGVTVIGIKMHNYRAGSIPIKYARNLVLKTKYAKDILNG